MKNLLMLVVGFVFTLCVGFTNSINSDIVAIKVLPVDEMEIPTDQYVFITTIDGVTKKYKYDAYTMECDLISKY